MGTESEPRPPSPERSDEPTPLELRAFVSLASALHFGRTARAMGVAQSSLSEAIRRLERKVDAILFERHSRRVELTSDGASLLPAVTRAVDALDAVRAADPAGSPAEGFPLRIGMEAHGFAELNGPILSGFHHRHPEVPLQLRQLVADPQAFFDSRLDVGLVRTPFVDERLEVHAVATERRCMLVPASHPAAGAEVSSVTDFFDEEFAALGPAIRATRDYWMANDRRGGEAARIGGEAITAHEGIHVVAHLNLVTMGCPSVARSFPSVDIACVELPDLAPCTLAMVTRRGDTRPIVAEFIDLARVAVSEFADVAPGITPVDLRTAALTGGV